MKESNLLYKDAPIRLDIEPDSLCKNCIRILQFDCNRFEREFGLSNGKKTTVNCTGSIDYRGTP